MESEVDYIYIQKCVVQSWLLVFEWLFYMSNFNFWVQKEDTKTNEGNKQEIQIFWWTDNSFFRKPSQAILKSTPTIFGQGYKYRNFHRKQQDKEFDIFGGKDLGLKYNIEKRNHNDLDDGKMRSSINNLNKIGYK